MVFSIKNTIDKVFYFTFFCMIAGCQDPVTTLDLETHYSVGTTPTQNLHSPQRYSSKVVLNLAPGSPITACIPNLPEPISISSQDTWNTYTRLNDGLDEDRAFFLNQAQVLQEPLYLNRWGEKTYEQSLVLKSQAQEPIFDILNINFGAAFEGKGLYTDRSALGSLGYSTNTFAQHIQLNDQNLDIPMLVTVRIPPGTFYIDIHTRRKLHDQNIRNYRGFVQSNSTDATLPPVVIHYNEISNSIPATRNPNGPQISTPVGSHWHVVKTTQGIEAKEFDGQEYTTAELIEFNRVMKIAVYQRNLRHAAKVYDYYQTRVNPILSKRIYQPDQPEQIPYPLTSLYPAKHWAYFEEMRHCIGASIPQPNEKLYYFWRYNGTCGGYADPKGHYLVQDPESHQQEKNYNALTDPKNQFCLEKHPSQAVWVRDDQLQGLRCMDVIAINDTPLPETDRYDSINFIVLGKHSHEADCGPQ